MMLAALAVGCLITVRAPAYLAAIVAAAIVVGLAVYDTRLKRRSASVH
jgi:hypothetical protein